MSLKLLIKRIWARSYINLAKIKDLNEKGIKPLF